MRLRPLRPSCTREHRHAYQAHLQYPMQFQLRSRRATRLGHEAAVSRPAHKPACAPLSAAQHNPPLLDRSSCQLDSRHGVFRPTAPRKQIPRPASTAMRPHADSDSAAPEPKPDELPRDAKLEAGYIRYIRILPTESSNGEVCLETCIRRSRLDDSSDEHPTTEKLFYSGISYSWGDPTPLHKVVVDGQERLVAENLWHFLQHANSQLIGLRLDRSQRIERVYADRASAPVSEWADRIEAIMDGRRKWPEDWLWIDALCIDQSNAQERTHQVGIMSEIFGRADQVISWLGPAYDNSEYAMAAIADHSAPYSSDLILSQAELAEAICRLCERQYWKRLWVFQELRHAQRIELICGTTKISWEQFTGLWRTIVDIAATDEDSSDRLKQSLATRMMTLRSKPINFSLWNLLKETRNLECANRLDRVYALLSVATNGHEDIEADYHLDHLRLAHRILHNKYAMRQPGTLDDVLMDCEFLEGVFRMNRGDMLRYRRYDANCDTFSHVRSFWYRRERMRSQGILEGFKGAKSRHEQVTSHIDTESAQNGSSWSTWAEFHEHTSVTRLLQDSE